MTTWNRTSLLATAFTLAMLGTLSTSATALGQRGDANTADQLKVARSLPGAADNASADRFPASAAGGADETSSLQAPELIFSEAHLKTCLKQIGDNVGDAQAIDIDGQQHKLLSLLSDRLTVLVFWSQDSVLAQEQFLRIPVDILADFAPQRVKVIAVHVGGNAKETKQLTGDAADKIVSLVDENQALFKQFATAGVPRTYVVDGQGKILWFEIEYSMGMQRSLVSALSYYLKK